VPFIPVRVTETWESLTVNGQTITLPPFALVVDFCLTPRARTDAPPDECWFPAVIDTGNTHNFSIRAAHFLPAALCPLTAFPQIDEIPLRYASGLQEIRPLHDGDLWVRSPVAATPPLHIELTEGFFYYEDGGPPYPILGTNALRAAGLCLSVDYEGRRASLTRGGPLRFGAFLVWHGAVTETQLGQALRLQGMRRRANRRVSLVEVTVPADPHRGVLGMRVAPEDVGRTIGQIAHELNVHTDGIPAGGPNDFLGEVLVELGVLERPAMEAQLQAFQALVCLAHLTAPSPT
jgi:hypothetical protein